LTSIDVQNGPHAVPNLLPLDERVIAKLKIPATDETRFWHPEVPGLYLRIRAGGSRTWMLQYRSGGVKRKVTLGRSPAMTAAAAAQAAKHNLARLAVGDDPAAARDATRAKAAGAIQIGTLVEDYLNHAAQKVTGDYLKDTRRYLTRDLKSLLSIPAADLTLDAMARALGKVTKQTAHNRCKAALTAFLKYAAGRGAVRAELYYSARMLPKFSEANRDRVLAYNELARIWEAAGDGTAGGTIIRLLILTGLRKSEMGGLNSSEVDRERRIITVAVDRMKAGEKHVIPITPLMESMLPARDGCVFGKTPAAPFSGWSRVKARIDAATKTEDGKNIPPWVVHDFRHTISTHLNEQPDANPDLIDRLLAHKRRGTERLYNHAQLVEAKRNLLLAWEELLRQEAVICDEGVCETGKQS
jgi:integrase